MLIIGIIKYTNKYMLLDEGEIAVLSSGGVDVYLDKNDYNK